MGYFNFWPTCIRAPTRSYIHCVPHTPLGPLGPLAPLAPHPPHDSQDLR